MTGDHAAAGPGEIPDGRPDPDNDDATDAAIDEARDERLLRAVAAAYGPDPAPAGLDDRVAALFGLRDLDAELLSLLDATPAELTGVRGPADLAEPDTLGFESADGELAVELRRHGDRLHGQVLGGPVTAVSVETTGGSRQDAPVDDLGRFDVTVRADGPVRLTLHRTGVAPPTRTDWFLP